MNLTDILWSLLYDRSFRQDAENRISALGSEACDLLRNTNLSDVSAMANQIYRSALFGGSCDGDGLLKQFPCTFECFEMEGIKIQDRIWDFLASSEFESYRVLPYSGLGVCLPEAFYKWALKCAPHSIAKDMLLYEARLAIATLIVSSYKANFRVDGILKKYGAAWIGLQHLGPVTAKILGNWTLPVSGSYVLIAATHRGLVKGPVSDEIASILSSEKSMRNEVDIKLCSRLSSLGIS